VTFLPAVRIACQTLVSGQTFAHLGLEGPVLYYSSGNSILAVPASGGASTTLVSEPSPITAIYPSTAYGVLWGEANGSVHGFNGDISYQVQAPVAGASITSVSDAGGVIVWAECFPQSCQVDGDFGGSVVSVATSGTPVDAQGDAGAWYWGDSDGLEKLALYEPA
jgi:hypothetical protein